MDQCKKACPEIRLFKVPEMRGKADLTLYRNASCEVFAVISGLDERIVVERASIDEAFMDLSQLLADPDAPDFPSVDTSRVGIAGYPDLNMDAYEKQVMESNDGQEENVECLLRASKIILEMRDRIKSKTGFTCSAGISYNKVLAKLACGMRKPNGQTIFPKSGVREVFKTTPIRKIRNLGGKMGADLSSYFQTEMMADLESYSLSQLASVVGNRSAPWVYGMIRGDDEEPVVSRVVPKSVGCGKNFTGLNSLKEVEHWVKQLSEEMVERLTEDQKDNMRRAMSMIFGVRFKSHKDSFSKTLKLKEYKVQSVFQEIMKSIINRIGNKDGAVDPIISLYLTASKFQDSATGKNSSKGINHYYQRVEKSSNGHPEQKSSPKRDGESVIQQVNNNHENDILNDNNDAENDDIEMVCEYLNGWRHDSDIEICNSSQENLISVDESSSDSGNSSQTIPEDSNCESMKQGFFYRKTLELILQNEDFED